MVRGLPTGGSQRNYRVAGVARHGGGLIAFNVFVCSVPPLFTLRYSFSERCFNLRILFFCTNLIMRLYPVFCFYS